MNTYRVSSPSMGLVFGEYKAQCEDGAVRAAVEDIGYESLAVCLEMFGCLHDDLEAIVVEDEP